MLKKFLCFSIIAATIFSLGACKPSPQVVDVYASDQNQTVDVPAATLSPEAAKVQLNAQNPDQAPKDYDPTQGKDFSKTHVDFTIGWGNGAVNMGDKLGQYIENKFNATFDTKIMPYEKIILLAAQNQLPDFFKITLGDSTYTQLEDQGFLYHIPRTDIANYPLLQRYFNNDAYLNAYSKVTQDKQYVGLPSMNNSTKPTLAFESSIYYRKDWAQKVGYDVTIDTVDKEYELAKRFRNDDPDGNGLKDTYGFTGGMWSIDWVPWVDTYSWVKETDPQSPYYNMYVPGFINSKMYGAIQWWNRALHDQLLPADYNLVDWQAALDKMIADQIGIAYGNAGDYWLWDKLSKFDVAHKDLYAKLPKTADGRTPTVNDVMSEFPPLKLNDSSEPRFPSMVERGITAISVNAGKDKVKMDRMYNFFEWSISQDGADTMAYGIKGQDYQIDSKGYVISSLPNSTTNQGEQKKIWEVYPSVIINQLVAYNGSTPTPARNSMYPPWIINRRVTTQAVKDKYAVQPTIDINILTCPAKDRHANDYNDTWFEDRINRVIAETGGVPIDQGWKNFQQEFLVQEEGDAAIRDINKQIQAKGLVGQQ